MKSSLRLLASLSIIITLVNITSCNPDKDEFHPVVSHLSITIGSVGRPVTITGENFSFVTSDISVAFNGTPADITLSTEKTIQTTVPSGATSGPISVTVKGKTTASPDFTVYVPGIIKDVNPICAPVGSTVTIKGTGFETDTNNIEVFFGSTDPIKGEIVSATSTEVKAIVPNIPTNHDGHVNIVAFGTEAMSIQGQGDLSNFWIGNPYNQGSSNDFEVQPYVITGFSPASGSVGSSVVISGSFIPVADAYTVLFWNGSNEATITSATSTSLTVTVPSGTVTGPITVFTDSGYFPSITHQAFTVNP
jgi:hypothetical protein